LGYTSEELAKITSPALVGESTAIKNVKIINRMYESMNAGKTLEKKTVRREPTQVEGSGEGIEKRPPSRDKLFQKQGRHRISQNTTNTL